MQYIGLRAIGKRMGWHPGTVINKVVRCGFLAYPERKGGTAIRWVTSDQLIHTWQVRQCELARQAYNIGHRLADRQRRADYAA